jgi:hypothetical protein
MQYKELFVRSYARSATNFIIHNVASICPKIIIHKSPWWEMDKKDFNAVTITVLRNPKDAIVSDIAMSLNDSSKEKLDVDLINYEYSINNFKNYITVLRKNINNIIPFTFEQITENPKKSFSVFLNSCGYEDDFYFSDVQIQQKQSINELMNKKQIFFPSSKPLNLYQSIEKYVTDNNILDSLNDDYKECMYAIYKRQLDF